MAMEIYCYKWTASVDGKVINEGVRKIFTDKMLDLYGTTNLPSLVNEWTLFIHSQETFNQKNLANL